MITLPALPAPNVPDIYEKSAETMEWFRNMVKVGYTDMRGPAWWANGAVTKDGTWTSIPDGSHYPGPVPISAVRKTLDVKLVKGTVYVEYIDDEGNKQVVRDSQVGPIVNAGTGQIFSYPTAKYAIHPYLDTLHGFIEQILDDPSVGVGSVGLLKKGGVAFLQAVLPESFEVAGYGYQPYVTAVTSANLSRSSSFSTGAKGAVCHAPGTSIIDGDWRGLVEDHHSFKGTIHAEGKTVYVRGLPFPENVSDDHRYWVREHKRSLTPATRKRLGVLRSTVGQDLDPHWVPAMRLHPVIHEIGYPIDMTTEPLPLVFADEETAWMLGYLWGNGHTSKTSTVTFSVPDSRDDLITRITAYAKSCGATGKAIQRQGCVQISMTDVHLHRALSEFKRSGWAQKVPPVWVERAPLEWQRSLVQGYYDADGNTDTTEGCILLSVSLDGLLALRRILMRLGIPSSIRRGSDPKLRSEIQGRKVNAQEIYSIRFWVNADQLGYSTRFKGAFSHPYIEDGMMWSRVESVDEWEGDVCPITTDSHAYVSDLGKSHNCDNTVDAAVAGALTQFKIRHTLNSGVSVQTAREKLGIRLLQVAETIGDTIEGLTQINVTEKQFAKWMDLSVPLLTPDGEPKSKAALTVADKKRDELTRLWMKDPKVAPWAGTAFGVLQLDNTFRTWNGQVQASPGGRFEKNLTSDVMGLTGKEDLKALDLLARVLRKKTLIAV